MITVDRKYLLVLSLAYIYLPIVIFFVTWTRPPIALVCLEVLLTCVFRCWKSAGSGELVTRNMQNIQINFWLLLLVGAFFIWIGYYAGYGRFVDQASDWEKHNAVLADLVNKAWPVYYSNGDEHSMLTYYIGQYIVPGLVGKIFHSFRCAEIALYVWNEIGVFLVFLYIISFIKARKTVEQVVVAIAIPFFSIPLWLSELILSYCTKFGFSQAGVGQFFIYSHAIKLQYSNNFVLLRWVFPQAITIWLILMIMLQYREYVKYYVLVMLPAILFGTFSFLGMLPLALGSVSERLIGKDRKTAFQIFSFENISVTLTAGLVLFFYFLGNATGEKPADIGFHLIPYTTGTISIYLVFVLTNVVLYSIILYQNHRKDGIYYSCFALLVILPLFSMGRHNDLVMRTSIPALFVLMIYLLLLIKEHCNKGLDALLTSRKVALCLILILIGAYYPFSEFSSCVRSEDYSKLGHGNGWASLEAFANRKANVPNDFKYNYYSYDLEDNIFYKYIAPARD